MIRYHTTLDRSAREIHDIGLEQIEKLAGGVPRARPGGPRDERRPEIFQRLRDDPALHHTNGADIVDRVEDGPGQGDGGHGRLVRDPAEGRLRRRGGPVRRDRVLLPAGQGRQPRRRLLHEHVRPDRLGPLPDRGDVVPRGHPRPSSPARDLDRARPASRSSASAPSSPPTARAGACTASGWPTRWACTRRRSTGWACSRPIRCAPAASSSTPGCTPSAGAASRRSTT